MSERMDKLQSACADAGIDALILNPGPTMTYLTGHEFDTHERLFLLILPSEGSPIAIVPQLEGTNFSEAVPEADAVYLWDDADGPEQAASGAFSRLAGARRVAVEPLGLRVMEYEHCRTHLPDAEFSSAESLVGTLRLYKDQDEATKIREAAKIAEASLERVLQEVEVGTREREIAAHLSSEMLRRGGEGISFGPIVLGGPKSALPHGVPDERELRAGEYLLIDFGTSYHGYHCDITRTFVVGAQPDDRQRGVYEAVREANRAGVRASKPGATYHEVHTTCQANFDDERFVDFMKHRTGHGLGLDVHEPPSVMRGNDDVVEVGTVFTVEPGLYLDGWGGVRIEDDVWITQDGCESLTRFPRELRVVGL